MGPAGPPGHRRAVPPAGSPRSPRPPTDPTGADCGSDPAPSAGWPVRPGRRRAPRRPARTGTGVAGLVNRRAGTRQRRCLPRTPGRLLTLPHGYGLGSPKETLAWWLPSARAVARWRAGPRRERDGEGRRRGSPGRKAGSGPVIVAGCAARSPGMACSCPGASHPGAGQWTRTASPGMLRWDGPVQRTRCSGHGAAANGPTRQRSRSGKERRWLSRSGGLVKGSVLSSPPVRSPRLAVLSPEDPAPPGPCGPVRASPPCGPAGHGRGRLFPGASDRRGHPESTPAPAGVR